MEHYFEGIDGWFWNQIAYQRLIDGLPANKPSTFVEVGCYKGKSLVFAGVEIIRQQKPVTLVGVDPLRGFMHPDQSGSLHELLSNVLPMRRVLNGRLHFYPEWSVEAAKHFAPESLDVVWLDADHSEEAVRADIDAWWPLVKPGGYLGGDDWLMAGVQKAVTGRFTSIELVPGWCTDGGRRDLYPSWLVQKVLPLVS